jgi:hypothetical protein
MKSTTRKRLELEGGIAVWALVALAAVATTLEIAAML